MPQVNVSGEQMFFPASAGWSKQMVLESIEERIECQSDEFTGINKPDPSKLTDELMEEFVAADWAPFDDDDFSTIEAISEVQEKALADLAEKIQQG